jgi:hypothetical protein
MLHQFVGQAGKTAQIGKHGASPQTALVDAVAEVFLDKMWQEMSQIRLDEFCEA